ncbi:hypothetical protein [Streptomyces coeruleorubidus]|uniref:hypothetical protein n=1 Tax=Streptomyces coeruleorubidus TaxID=116188 RepID=UPI0036CE39F0
MAVIDRAKVRCSATAMPGIPGILAVSVGVMPAEPRRYWLDRDGTSGLGAFHAPALL